MTSRKLTLLVAFVALCLNGCATYCDVRICGGTVIDGTGAPGRLADVLITGGHIVFVGRDANVVARKTIDATGKVVTPGFIDPHAHGDPRRTPGFENFVAMGVTTICLGQDGSSPAGLEFAKWLEIVRRGKIRPNIAPFVGHGTLRHRTGIGLSSNPSTAQLEQLWASADRAMTRGAFGISMGLEYEPGRFAKADELAGIFRVVTAHGGLVMSHVRSEDDDALELAVEEFCGASPVGGHAHVSHMKVVFAQGHDRADELLATLEIFRQTGRRVTADVYPYVASYTGIGIVFPHWARPPNDYAKVKTERYAELVDYLHERVNQRNGPEATLFGSGRWAGKTLAEAAVAAGKPFPELLIDLGPRGASAAYFVMDRELMERLLSADHVVVSSDGSPTMRHPRGHGAFARVIREFVVERALLSIEKAIHKMTGLTAEIVGLHERGRIAAGMVADILVFDPQEVRELATFAKPFRKAVGFDTILIGGTVVREHGAFTDAKPGHLLHRH